MTTRDELNNAWITLYNAQKELLETLPKDCPMTTPFDEFMGAMLSCSDEYFTKKVIIACGNRLTKSDTGAFMLTMGGENQ